ncbi:MAG TPA: FAD-dependent monooxygenase [Stackebrandtia sp.]|jgi:pentachlorophenol monooxygenase/3-(3-hydroxy-phenyl)propionate hydroxylase|uniref:FAD-dependent monooxygenase n=1 Tax=Stackebrandtia sp. TaxID=2023065 RepID=UPI002D2CE9A1|nr:FAD-dependent monooxygenase [Stackebrandtia sp.]HZE41772.1 FAD-dependent monooxygenase [Stackebrandtia sp.]
MNQFGWPPSVRATTPRAAARAIVIGAGPVGQTTALLLARWGLAVELLDAAPRRDAVGSKSICQQRDVLDIWSAVGAPDIAAEGLTWTTARTFYRDREIHRWSFAPTTGTPPFVNISQTRTEHHLDRAIARQPRIRVTFDARATAITDHGTHPRVRLADGRALAADYVVACTGARDGGLRDSLGITFDGTTHPDRFLICDIAADLPGHAHERHFHFDPSANPGRQILIHPCPQDTYRIDWQVAENYRADRDDLDARIRAVLGDTPYRLLWNTAYRFHSRIASTLHTGRVLLAGDAAHLCAPFGARGLNSGIADAENAAWKIAAHAHGWAAPDILATYHTERHAAARENQSVVDATMDLLAPTTPQSRHRRRATLTAAANDPARAAAIDSGRFAEPYWYDASPLTTPDPTRAAPGRPPKGQPQPAAPGTITPDTPLPDATPLRQALRGHFTLLTTQAASHAPPPLRTLTLTPATAETIGMRPNETWLVRPDAHLAATLTTPTPDDVTAALRRAVARHPAPQPR